MIARLVRLSTLHPVDWEFAVRELYDLERYGEVSVGSGMYVDVIGWYNAFSADNNHVIAEGDYSSLDGLHAKENSKVPRYLSTNTLRS